MRAAAGEVDGEIVVALPRHHGKRRCRSQQGARRPRLFEALNQLERRRPPARPSHLLHGNSMPGGTQPLK
jgi:hypothetical protein